MFGKLFLAAFVAVDAVIVYYLLNYEAPPPPDVPKNAYWGLGQPKKDRADIVEFKVSFDNATVTDLRQRLRNTRWYDSLEESNFEYGFNIAELRKVHDYWLNKYDYQKAVNELNQFPQYTTEIEGLQVHFIHAKPLPNRGYKRIVPVLIVHGWPGSVYEFYKLIPMLIDPMSAAYDNEIAFEVIAPSIPGYGWSQASSKKGFDAVACARIFDKLMQRVGHKKYYTQGGDWGSAITMFMAQLYPERVLGSHLNMVMMLPGTHPVMSMKLLVGALMPSLVVAPDQEHKMFPLAKHFLDIIQESGYFHIQATKPDTVGFALNDSPMGLAAYILEKFSTWTSLNNRMRADGGLTTKFTMDELLTNIMIYWTTGSIASSQRFYKEFFISPYYDGMVKAAVKVPVAYACFPHDLGLTPKEFMKYKYTNVVQYTDMPRGGHFAALEESALVADDLRNFILKLV